MKTVIFFIDNKLGGVSSLNYNLISSSNSSDFFQTVVVNVTHLETQMAKADIEYPANSSVNFKFSSKDNFYKTISRLSKAFDRKQEGALVLNYHTEMAMLDHHPVAQTTFQLVHDDYNVGLAEKYGHVVDVFICHNTVIYEKLRALFPDRLDTIFYLRHGVRIPTKWRLRTTQHENLKLLFIGRMVSAKGIFDLPVINDLLRKKGVRFEWTCIGNGPELEQLKKVWNPMDKVRFVSPESNAEVLSIAAEQDVFVLPTKFEGSPVSLLEAMSVGLVPVVSKVPGGITDIISEKIGYLIPIDDNVGFADAIGELASNRTLLDELGGNARKKIVDEYDLKVTAATYYDLFGRYKEFYKTKKIKKIPVGARLDQPYLPNIITYTIRSLVRNGA